MRRVGVFGWGVVAPRSPDVASFAHNLESAESWLEPFDGFGPNNFLVGRPTFDLERYRPWIDERFPPSRFRQIADKMGYPCQYAIGAFLQALEANPGIEGYLKRLGSAAHIYVGTGVGDIPTQYEQSVRLHHAQRRWNRFWASPERNEAMTAYLAGARDGYDDVPQEPETVDVGGREEAEEAWWAYWAARSDQLAEYLAEVREIESINVGPDKSKMAVMKEKRTRNVRLQEHWGAPEPPWSQVSANVIWNIHNSPAAQLSMLGGITGLCFAPVAACSTFSVSLKLALDAIRSGEAKAVVVGATDPPPHPLVVGAFYAGRVIAADASVSKPLTGMRGTHVSGGSAIWIVGDYDALTAEGFEPLGMEPLAVGVSADADHIITPSEEGPTNAIRDAIAHAGVDPDAIGSWDLHATATPGDITEIETLRGVLPEGVVVTARKGTFGHGMAASGGWELTAQYLGYERGALYPTPLSERELNEQIAGVHQQFVFDASCEPAAGPAGKLSMGIGGINGCVISRPLQR